MSSISVCMATFNGEEYIAKQLECILSQSLQPDQLIVCDDASKDKTIEIIKSITKKANFEVKLLINENSLGVVKNFEKAISYSSSDIIVFADQDDLWEKNRLFHIRETFLKKDIDYYFSDSKIIDSNDRVTETTLWNRRLFNSHLQASFNTKDQLSILLKFENFIYGMTLAFKAKHLNKILPIESHSKLLTHDTWIPMILSGLNFRGYADSLSTTFYREHKNQLAGPGESSGFINKLYKSLKNKRYYDSDLSKDLERISVRILMLDKSCIQSADLLNEKANHLRLRSKLKEMPFIRRLNLIFKEILSKKYIKFSSSRLTPLRDLIN